MDSGGGRPLSVWRAVAVAALLTLVVVVAVVGGVVAVVNPSALSVSTYLRDLTIIAAALALGLGGVRLPA
jgi:hypothetical protein